MASSAITGPVLSDVRRSPSGSAAAPSWSFADATGTGVYLASTDVLALSTAGVQRVVVDAAGNVGIGGAPTGQANFRTFELGTTGVSGLIDVLQDGARQLRIYNNSNNVVISNTANEGATTFITTSAGGAASERMRIDSVGNLLVGTSSIGYIGSESLTLSKNSGTTKWSVGPYAGQPGQFYVASAAGVGVYLSSTSATSWSSNSDERLKTNLQLIQNAEEKINKLRAVTGRYKTDEEQLSRSFLIAQDVQKVLPEAVSTTKIPGMEDDGEYLALAYTDVIPLLVAAIQELSAKVDAQAAEIEALKAK